LEDNFKRLLGRIRKDTRNLFQSSVLAWTFSGCVVAKVEIEDVTFGLQVSVL